MGGDPFAAMFGGMGGMGGGPFGGMGGMPGQLQDTCCSLNCCCWRMCSTSIWHSQHSGMGVLVPSVASKAVSPELAVLTVLHRAPAPIRHSWGENIYVMSHSPGIMQQLKT